MTLRPRQQADLDLIAVGGLSPLTGFMGQADHESVVSRMRLADDPAWSIPITLCLCDGNAARVTGADEVAEIVIGAERATTPG